MGDGKWHSVKAWRSPCCWHLSVDEKYIYEPIRTRPKTRNRRMWNTNVYLQGGHAFLGGRPGYSSNQFMGSIKNVKVNNRPIWLQRMQPKNGAAVARCESEEFTSFMQRVTAMTSPAEVLAEFYDMPGPQETENSNYDSESSFFDYERQRKKQKNPKWSVPYPGIGRR
ncbi:hypothetical protein CAPTEDRAFT_202740 [Capitella teleta]|uniref:Laminin G domain-containing protein n=1 Tax=Capitella teleta TaxID=283909 RepID=R7T9N2_CAPTE|nr:hypothetical protein CAPTEDRAFT_202740 [Capitella teleta]|eukprot:ELT88105.1 hypothetical protein CAPTEDRAFT_202740 [Capitella teleta]